MDFGNIINNLLNQMAFFHLGAGNYVMIVVALVFLYLAIRKGFEPLLLIRLHSVCCWLIFIRISCILWNRRPTEQADFCGTFPAG